MSAPLGNRNNTRGNPNLKPFDSKSASEAGKKSAAARRAKRQELQAANAVTRKDIAGWIDTYERDQLSQVTAAAAQKIAHMILDGEITDDRALIQALPALVEITRLEEGLHTTATMHAQVSMTGDPMERIRAIRAAARGEVVEVASTDTPALNA